MEEILGGKVVIVSGNGNNETEKKIKEGIMREAEDLNRIEFTNDKGVKLSGSSLMGYIETTYDELCKMFGPPTFERSKGHDLDKVNAEWNLSFTQSGKETKISIYDWKKSTTPLGLYDWHIGGFGEEALDILHDFIMENLTEFNKEDHLKSKFHLDRTPLISNRFKQWCNLQNP